MRKTKNMCCDHRRLTCNGARRGGSHIIIVVGPLGPIPGAKVFQILDDVVSINDDIWDLFRRNRDRQPALVEWEGMTAVFEHDVHQDLPSMCQGHSSRSAVCLSVEFS
jgi:hypothetical protein